MNLTRDKVFLAHLDAGRLLDRGMGNEALSAAYFEFLARLPSKDAILSQAELAELFIEANQLTLNIWHSLPDKHRMVHDDFQIVLLEAANAFARNIVAA